MYISYKLSFMKAIFSRLCTVSSNRKDSKIGNANDRNEWGRIDIALVSAAGELRKFLAWVSYVILRDFSSHHYA